ncbi:MAG: hypothetical protein IJS60_10280 [Abditibacteriota bacterium]|nr:hypothetical protein [Abditibacteriota bacterium]
MKMIYTLIIAILIVSSIGCIAATEEKYYTPNTKSPDIKITGDWQLTIGGDYDVAGTLIHIPEQTITVEKPTIVSVKNEKYENIGIFDPKAPFWCQGVRVQGTSNGETGARGSLDAKSFVVKGDPEGKVIYKLDKDYGLGAEWGFFGRLANENIVEDRTKGTAMIDANLLDQESATNVETQGSSIKEGDTVYVDYEYAKWRLDTIATDKNGKLSYITGEAGIQIINPPTLPEGLYPVCNIFTRSNTDKIHMDMIYPITELRKPAGKNEVPAIKTLLTRTYDKLVNKKEICILYWGDSVTCGGSVTDYDKYVWQNVVSRELEKKYPNTKFRFETTAWGGRGVGNFFETPIGQAYNFQEHVLDLKPDLVIMEFVNDTYQFITPDLLVENYNKVRDIFAEKDIDWVIMLPHFTDFDRASFGTEKYRTEQRWYDKWIRKEYCEKYPNIAVADASVLWGHLLFEGIPFCTLNVNGINHPCNEGHQILANGVLDLF